MTDKKTKKKLKKQAKQIADLRRDLERLRDYVEETKKISERRFFPSFTDEDIPF